MTATKKSKDSNQDPKASKPEDSDDSWTQSSDDIEGNQFFGLSVPVFVTALCVICIGVLGYIQLSSTTSSTGNVLRKLGNTVTRNLDDIKGKNTELSQRLEGLEGELTTIRNDIDAKHEDLDGKDATVAAEVDRINKTIDETLNKLIALQKQNNKTTAEINELESGLSEKLTTLEEGLNKKLEGYQEGVNEKISGFETGFNSKIGGLAERQESLEGNLNKMNGDLNGRLSSLADSQKQSDIEIANTVENLAKSTLGRLDELAKRVIASSSSVEREIGTLKSQKVPVGTILPFGAKINSSGGFQQLTEAGWLLCNGNTLSREDYAPLYKAIGSSWGAGDSTSTFNLPDLNNKGLNPEGEDTTNSGGLSWIIRVR